MTKSAKILVLLACGLLAVTFLVPIWHIKLDAPQYPGGLDMYIWINKITGTDEFTLQNINILNHYIGMEPIHPDSFSELRIMPYMVVFFLLTGLLTAFLNSKKILTGWLALLIIGGTVGLVDFYIWQQEFGNNLSTEAPIKVPGMSYSPPFIGKKSLLNIVATSYPAWGGIAFALALLAATTATFLSTTKKHNNITGAAMPAFLLLIFSSCSPEQKPISYGFDACALCKMTITDQRYGSELVTEKGKIYMFDSIECMAEYVNNDLNSGSAALLLVTDFKNPGQLIDAKNAVYLHSKGLPSPMGMYLTAFIDQNAADELLNEKGGNLLNWEETKALCEKEAVNR